MGKKLDMDISNTTPLMISKSKSLKKQDEEQKRKSFKYQKEKKNEQK